MSKTTVIDLKRVENLASLLLMLLTGVLFGRSF